MENGNYFNTINHISINNSIVLKDSFSYGCDMNYQEYGEYDKALSKFEATIQIHEQTGELEQKVKCICNIW